MLRREDPALLHPLGPVVRKRMICQKPKRLLPIRTKLGVGVTLVAKIAAVEEERKVGVGAAVEEEQQALAGRAGREVRVQPLIPIPLSVDALR